MKRNSQEQNEEKLTEGTERLKCRRRNSGLSPGLAAVDAAQNKQQQKAGV